jgi:hypothetical protein
VITEDAMFTVAARRQRTPVIAGLLPRPADPGHPRRLVPRSVRLAGLHRRSARVRDRVRGSARACGAWPGRVYSEEFFTEPQPWGAAQPATAARSRS